ncbi:spindle pole body interacting protein [Neolentinus lepideus HHB14362 ss-1]|uniref:Spindle pole body interacting protein n=1 Tax=Neolentinus lepideus HHB14362 ss-1 TaxID=1314782 RepID=A0A165SUK2_9AGAM|nr:spindle pole body interacting protein [Neolentinus lepideus HHB14362 ss-1]
MSNVQHCSFVLLAEFDIDRGAQLTYQFPQPLGTDEGLLANLMLPDGAEKQLEDWTIFFLNQTPFNTIAPVLALEDNVRDANGVDDGDSHTGLLYVLNLVRTKHDKTVRRGAVVKAMAICTRYPFIQIFKVSGSNDPSSQDSLIALPLQPVLLMALDDYFADPSQECFARLFDAINSMDISGAPTLCRYEKLVMRTSERKDMFAEKFAPQKEASHVPAKAQHRQTPSWGSHSSFEDGVMTRARDSESVRDRDQAVQDLTVTNNYRGQPAHTQGQYSPTDTSFGSAVWVGDESGLEGVPQSMGATMANTGSKSSIRGRSSTDASSSSSHVYAYGVSNIGATSFSLPTGMVKDTHFFQTSIAYRGHTLPIKMPLSTFPEEVGDYSLIQLIQTFSNPTVTGPLHPHLHNNGSLTHPIIILFNALVTGKRIIFLGHNQPAGQVSSYVLSACALGSGCGCVLRGFIERAFPYANLTNKEEWESIPGYIAGVTNPIFEHGNSWDLLCDIGTLRMVVNKDIHLNYPVTTQGTTGPPLIMRTGTLKAESSIGSEEDVGRSGKEGQKGDMVAKADSSDNLFIEDVISAISYHFGENLVRSRFAEYVGRFVRLAARYEEEIIGPTKIGYPSVTYQDGRLGSGMAFSDETSAMRELQANASRIEGWRKTNSYRYFQEDFEKALSSDPIQGFDVLHQIWRFRHAKNMPDSEVDLIMRTLVENVQTYDQVVELLSFLPPHYGGLLPLSFGLFHQQEIVRELTVELFNQLRIHPVGYQFLQALNHFHRYAYVRLAHAREIRQQQREQNSLYPPVSIFNSRTPSNRSESSLGG